MAGNGNSGRPSLPASVHLLRGNPSGKNVAALLDEVQSPTVPVKAPPMPDVLSDDAKAEWERVVPALMSMRLLSELDAMALAAYCQAAADWRRYQRLIAAKNAKSDDELGGDVQTFKTGAQQMHVLRQLANDAERRANAAGAHFGMSPVSRRNLKAPAPPQGELFPNDPRAAAERYFS